MIPACITRVDIAKAMRRIKRNGVPPGRQGRNYCLVANGGHLPPKYTISLAHEIATGEALNSNRFSGGAESNNFLRRYGFKVVECICGGGVQVGSRATSVSGSSERGRTASTRHSERCPECKQRVRELLERIYGSCLPNHGFGWQTDLAPYAETSIGTALQDVATVLQTYRGFGIRDFVRSDTLAGCDFWVPDPGFIVEFDESQHFTRARKLALSVYADDKPLGFSAKRWITLCEQHNAKDNDPPFRDEQRAWYDTLRDLVPSVKGLRPTVRLYARDRVWCSLDPDSAEDQERFSDLVHQERPPSGQTTAAIRSLAVRPTSILRVAMVFPHVEQRSKNGVPPSGAKAHRPKVPTRKRFADEAVDFVLFPEGYIRASDVKRKRLLQDLASELDAPLLVGATDNSVDPNSCRDWSKLPNAEKQKCAPKSKLSRRVRVALKGGQPAVFGCSGWKTGDSGLRADTEHGPVYVEVVPGERILDASECFGVLDQANEMKCTPIIWNHWEQLPADSARLATLMMGRAIECCAPIVISDRGGICELVELSNRNKIPARRKMEESGEAIADIRYAWGLKSAFKMVKEKIPSDDMKRAALDRYRSLG